MAKTKLDHAIKKEWVDLLRGRTIKQCTGVMVKTSGECCALGVLAKILEKRGIVDINPPTDPDDDVMRVAPKGYGRLDGYTGVLPEPVTRGLGVYARPDGGRTYEFDDIHRNNDRGDSFAEIADWIETNL